MTDTDTRPAPDDRPRTPEAPPEQDSAYGLPADLVREIEEALDAHLLTDVERLVQPLHSADLADLLESLHPEDRMTLAEIIRPQLQADPEVLTYLNDDVLEQIVEILDPVELATALSELDSDDAIGVLEDMDEDDRQKILAALPSASRRLVEEGLTFPEESAGRLMQREFVAVPKYWTVGKTIDYLRAAETLPDDFYLIFAIDPMMRPVGAVLLSRILRSKRSIKIADLMDDEIRTILATTDQEEVAFLFRQYGLVSAPVVDESGRLLGAVTVDDVVDVIHEEAEEDILKLGGVSEADIFRDVLNTLRSRFSWLGINLVTAILASAVIAVFEGTIEQLVALAVLMPIVASMGGNAGTQTLTVAVRGIAMRELTSSNARRVMWKEIMVGVLNGVAFAVVAGGVAAVWFGDPMLALVIGAAMIVTLTVAALFGTLIPLALDRLKIDPAVASGVFLTTVTDVVGFFAFLGLAAWILL